MWKKAMNTYVRIKHLIVQIQTPPNYAMHLTILNIFQNRLLDNVFILLIVWYEFEYLEIDTYQVRCDRGYQQLSPYREGRNLWGTMSVQLQDTCG